MDETTKAMIKDMLKRGSDNSTIMSITGATQEQIDQVATEGKSSFLDKLGIFSTAQASEINSNNPPSMLPKGAMDTETPFGDMLKPEVPRGGSIFSGREFGNIRGGIVDGSAGQRFNVENNPELFFNTKAGKAEADKNFFDSLTDLSGGVVDFGKDIAGRSILSQVLAGAGSMIDPTFGLAAGITGLLKGGDLFNAPYIGADSSITGTPLAQFAFRNELRRDPTFDIGRALNMQNAAGGYYSDFARTQRSLANRFSNLIDRAQSGKTFSTRNLLGISNALGMGVTKDDINKIVSGEYDLNTGTGPSGAGTFTADSLSKGFAGEEGPTTTTSNNYEDFDTMYSEGGIVSL